ncbi:MAG: hypothetical protein IJ111_05975 [Eggerthellaceae bacterium]|nr:hypothetical protein [Eggerthellaceae bacterium]
MRNLFADYLSGSGECIALTLSKRPLGEEALNAIEKSLENFGYGLDSCTYATLSPIDRSVEGGDIALDAQALFLMVEGLDPLFVICADEASAHALGQAYRTAFPPDAPARILGRPAVVFKDFPALMNSEKGKQKAWHLLKSLPKR